MPRLRQVPKDEATAPIVTTMYEWLFEGRDPVAEPGRWDGTTGDWWTVFANSPDILDHCVKGFGLYQSPDRTLDPTLRELGQIRAGYAAASQFVYSQHAKSMRELGMPEEQITHIPAWSVGPRGHLQRRRAGRPRLHRHASSTTTAASPTSSSPSCGATSTTSPSSSSPTSPRCTFSTP